MKYLELQDTRIPALGFGTWQLTGDACVEGVADALEIGYRHIDTAQMYENEEQVGQGIVRSGVPREEIFLTTKIMPDNLKPRDVIKSTRRSLEKLDLTHVDLLLIHWPNPDVPLLETLDAMEGLRAEGATRHIGVSNFTPSLVDETLSHSKILCNQVEYHPYLAQDHLLAQARKHEFMLTAYCPLARGRVTKDQTLEGIGQTHGKTSAQVALRWLIEQDNVASIPKAATAEHRRQNFDIFDFELSDDEMKRITALGQQERIVDPDWAPAWER